MLVWRKIVWLREQIKKQKEWIDRCGGSLSGYIEHYGDPGVPPLQDGKPKILTIAVKDQHLAKELVRVPNTEDQFYAPHFGNGGTAIYKADSDRLSIWHTALSELEMRNWFAKQKANEMEKKGYKVK